MKPLIFASLKMFQTNHGGLLHRKKAPKRVLHHANLANPQRPLIRLNKLYNERCAANRPDNAFYLRPWRSPGLIVGIHVHLWDTTCSPVQFEAAGATAATRMFDAGIDEQLIMYQTGQFCWGP